jgi:chemotaxis signal transduction protein
MSGVTGTAAALRETFDQSFAAPAAAMTERLVALLAIRIAADPYVLRLAELAGLHKDLRLVAIPGPDTRLLGIVALRGVMAPVYDLAALLHYPAAQSPRWIVLTADPHPIGFAFDVFESRLQGPESSLAGVEAGVEGDPHRQHTQGTVRAAGAPRSIIHMASLLTTIKGNRA